MSSADPRTVAEAAAWAGGSVLLRHLHGDLDIAYKEDRANLVTVADKESQRVVREVIRRSFPGHAVIGEEDPAGDAPGEAEPGDGDAGNPDAWYVDPLDGTTNYAHGLPFFCVSVAYRHAGATMAGAVFDPLRDEMFTAGRRAGSSCNGAPLHASAIARLDRSLIVAQAQSVDPGEIRAYTVLVERLMHVAGGVRSLGSPALTLCAIAAGRCEAYCEYAMDAWDIAAGQLILEEAGGRLTTFSGEPHTTADRADVVATNGLIHDDLVTALKGLLL